jgi:hypothetical protein
VCGLDTVGDIEFDTGGLYLMSTAAMSHTVAACAAAHA